MKEGLKNIIECGLLKFGKEENLDKLDNLKKVLYSEFGTHGDIGINLFQLFDDISLKLIDKTYYERNDSLAIWRTSNNQESKMNDKFDELCYSIESILGERSHAVFYAQ